MYLLDNDIFSISIVRRTRAPNLERKIEETVSRNQLFLPIVAVRESVGGAISSLGRVESTERVLSGYTLLRQVLSGIATLPIIPLDDQAVAIFQSLPRQLRNAIGLHDSLIAAMALRHDLILATGNIADFEQVPNLRFEDWLRLPNPQ